MANNIDTASTRIEREKNFHDQRFSDPDTRRANVGRFYKITGSIFEDFKRILSSGAANSRVLEYGCGTGSYIFEMTDCGAKSLVGIDISPVAISQAQDRANDENTADKLEFTVMNAEDLSFPDDSLDLIFGSGILHHLDLEKSVASISRVLDSEGKAVFIEPMGHNPLINAYRNLTPNIRSVDEHPLLMKDIALLKSHFQQVNVKYYYLFSLGASLLSGTPLFASALKFFSLIDTAVLNIPLFQRNAWFALIEVANPIPARS